VLNDTRVTARRLFGRKPTGGQVELLLMKDRGGGRYEALVRPGRRLRPGAEVVIDGGPTATVLESGEGGMRVVQLDTDLGEAGDIPLPPYFHGRLDDPQRYQTVYAEACGSAAAPTAGLHFTPELLHQIGGMGVGIVTVTLHIGLDTFRPMSDGPIAEHKMHGESLAISAETARAVRSTTGRIIAVGTTSVRVLESAGPPAKLREGTQTTRVFIAPGWRFNTVSGMVTNFHMPRTTMLVMVCAFAGRERVLTAYDAAKRAGYRFLSFGDSMAIL
jgi:S-adenosylmethionine:tRNA ribosyltransferase-isomerase